jgi:hypothetical protein
LKIKNFLEEKRIRNGEDYKLQNQLFAYFVAKHYSISLQEVLTMPIEIFNQSLNWAIVMEEKERAERNKELMENKTSNETITLDYSFLDSEEGQW